MIITIDGPAASGKSTIARMVANKLNLFYLYTGLLYRSAAYILKTNNRIEAYLQDKAIDLDQVKADLSLEDYVYTYTAEQGIVITYKHNPITPFLYTAEISNLASLISSQQAVRELLMDLLHRLIKGKNIVADGRDCGTILFPNAQFKFFLTASTDIRALRWEHDQAKQGNIVTYEEAIKHIHDRDFRDTTRLIAPLIPASDAFIIDNSLLTIQETADLFLKIISQGK